jgi:leader peptidase (prepilin peptidase)/N-methyltransferase
MIWIWPTLLGVLGLVFGSFIATLALRWPEGGSALAGRSTCDHCGAGLRWFELAPVLSFAVQHGRCRRCGGRIDRFHLAIELLGGAIGMGAGLVAPGVEGAGGAVFGWLLLTLGAIDARAYWLPDPLVAALAAAGLASALVVQEPVLAERLAGGVAGYGVLSLAALAYARVRGRMGLGGGDPKLFGAIGLWLGWRALAPVMLAAALAGLAVAIVRGMRSDERLPLGSLLAAAAFLWWLVRESGLLTRV